MVWEVFVLTRRSSLIMHPRPPGRHIGNIRDQQLTTNFELWVEILCADMFPYEDSKTPSVCPYPEKINHNSFVNNSPTLVIDTSMKGLHEYYNMETPKLDFSKKFEIEFWLVLNSWSHLNFVNISPTLVIDASMERSSRVLQHGYPKILNFIKFRYQKCGKIRPWDDTFQRYI